MYLKPLLCLIFIFTCFSGKAQGPCLKNAHSHNDYRQKRPLSDALQNGFNSMEADVFLVKGQLLVSHLPPRSKKCSSLEALYLLPLKTLFDKQQGMVYSNGSLILLIDIKSNATDTYRLLSKLLEQYRAMLTRYEDGKIIAGAVTIILSGNKPYEELQKEKTRFAFIDQSLLELDQPRQEDLCLMASTKYSSILKWKGKGLIPAKEKNKLMQLVKQAHEQGKKVRLWASPENKIVWKELLDCGVDLINTNKLEELKLFLASSATGPQ
ncbi:MAG TPA: phosphatidylinositol-specific phospholipase C/glycerophosphodiester phosphodiesterase family protein [Bacteroidia bacterium]|jgi:hypothetical protein